MTGTVCTLFEIQHGDDTKNQGGCMNWFKLEGCCAFTTKLAVHLRLNYMT